MANLADEYGTDVEIYIKALTTTLHDIRTRAARPAAQHPAPAGSPSRPAQAGRAP